jgi:hypothetical protein
MKNTIKDLSFYTHTPLLKALGFKRTQVQELLSVFCGFKTFAALKNMDIQYSDVSFIMFDEEKFSKKFNAFSNMLCNTDIIKQFLSIIEENSQLSVFNDESELVEYLTQDDNDLVSNIIASAEEYLSGSMEGTSYIFDAVELEDADFELQKSSLKIGINLSIGSSPHPDRMISTDVNQYSVFAKVCLPKVTACLYGLPNIDSIDYSGHNTFYDNDSSYGEV